jgi:tetratricopeptide (TPR) repeat protein
LDYKLTIMQFKKKLPIMKKHILRKLFLAVSFLAITSFLFFGCDKKNDKAYLNYYKKGEAYLSQKNNIEAVNYFSKSIESNPNFPHSYVLRANAYIELKEYDKAEKDLQKVIHGNYGEYALDAANYMMFFVYSKQQKRENAFKYLDKSLGGKGEFFKTNPTAIARGYMELYGISLLKEKKFKEAQNVSLKALKYFPDEYHHYVSLAYIEEKYYSNSEKALLYLKKAKELSKGEISQDPEVSLKNLKKMN